MTQRVADSYEKIYNYYFDLNYIIFHELNLHSRLDKVIQLQGEMNNLFQALLQKIKDNIGTVDTDLLLNSCGSFQRFRVHIDKDLVKQADEIYYELLRRKFHHYTQKFDEIFNQDVKSGTLIFISGLPRAGNSIFANIGCSNLLILDEPASWEVGGFKEKILVTLLSGKNICIIRPNFVYVMPPVISFMRDLHIDVSGIYLERNIGDIAKSYLKRSAISKKTKVNWLPQWDDKYALYEFTDHLRLLREQKTFFLKQVRYEDLRSNIEEWQTAVSYIYSIAGLSPDNQMICSTFDFNSKFTTDTPSNDLKLLELP